MADFISTLVWRFLNLLMLFALALSGPARAADDEDSGPANPVPSR